MKKFSYLLVIFLVIVLGMTFFQRDEGLKEDEKAEAEKIAQILADNFKQANSVEHLKR